MARLWPGRAAARASGWLQAGPLQSWPMLPLTPRRAPVPTPSDRPASRPGPADRLPTLVLSVDGLLLLACAWFALLPNRSFVQAALKGRDWGDLSAWGFGAALVIGVLALHLLVLVPLSTRWTAKPLLALMIVVSAFASFYIQQYGVYLDPTMLRNVLRTDPHEAGELLSLSLALHLLLYAVLPLLVLWRVRLALWSWKRSLLTRLGLVAATMAVLVATLLAVFQPFSSLMRNHKELRYLITPANVLWSLASVAGADAKACGAAQGHRAGCPARPVLGHADPRRACWCWWWAKPRARPTGACPAMPPDHARAGHAAGRELQPRSPPAAPTPRPRCPACSPRWAGATTTRPRIRRQRIAAARAGPRRRRRCTGATTRAAARACAKACPTTDGEHRWPAGLCAGRPLHGRRPAARPGRPLRQARGTQLLVLHQLGNHGPSYYRRYPAAFARFKPACRSDDLRAAARGDRQRLRQRAAVHRPCAGPACAHLQAQRRPGWTARCCTCPTTASRWARTTCSCTACPTPSRPTCRTQVPMADVAGRRQRGSGGARRAFRQPLPVVGVLVRSAHRLADAQTTKGRSARKAFTGPSVNRLGDWRSGRRARVFLCSWL
jgi:lipid A ethanolaminephosphotransferase